MNAFTPEGLRALLEDKEITLHLFALDAFMAVSALQLALRHPYIPDAIRACV